jgi:hypothetical protein
VSKDYQKKPPGRARPESPAPGVPDVVSVVMGEVAADLQEGLLAGAVGAGLQVMAAMTGADVDAPCGPKGRHDRTGRPPRPRRLVPAPARDALEAEVRKTFGPAMHDEGINAARHHPAATEAPGASGEHPGRPWT